LTQTFKGLWAGHFVHQMAVDVQDCRTIFFGMDNVFVPEFVVESASHVFIPWQSNILNGVVSMIRWPNKNARRCCHLAGVFK
jgi:hypothetical protein